MTYPSITAQNYPIQYHQNTYFDISKLSYFNHTYYMIKIAQFYYYQLIFMPASQLSYSLLYNGNYCVKNKIIKKYSLKRLALLSEKVSVEDINNYLTNDKKSRIPRGT